MSELTQTQLTALVTAYGQAAARTARAPRNSPAARYAFEAENAACASLLAAIGSLVKERDEVQAELDEWRFTNGVDVLRRERDAAVRALNEERAGWQPIETAPQDGTTILVSFGRVGVWAVEWFEALGWCVNDNKHDPIRLRGWGYGDGREPTHWREMPAGPEVQS